MDDQVHPTPPQGVLPVNVPAAVGDPLEEAHHHQLEGHLEIRLTGHHRLAVLMPEVEEASQQTRHVEPTVSRQVPLRAVRDAVLRAGGQNQGDNLLVDRIGDLQLAARTVHHSQIQGVGDIVL